MSALASIEHAIADSLSLPAAAGMPALGIFLAYAGAAALCMLAARGAAWRCAAAALLVLGLDSLLHGDRLFVLWIREVAGQQGWYAHRRVLQVGALAAGTAAALAALRWASAGRDLRSLPTASVCLLYSLCGLGVVHALRLVSLHHTDLLLDLRLPGASLGRWIECLALALAAFAAGLQLGTPPVRPFREFPNV